MEFLKDQYRHCKPILASAPPARCSKVRASGPTLPDGTPDPGVLHCEADDVDDALERFVEAIVKHRHYERETDPPRV